MNVKVPDYKNLRILQVARDAGDTGGGRVVLETSKQMVTLGCKIKLLTDVSAEFVNDNSVDIITTPFGQRLKCWSPQSKLGRVLRHTLQLMAFTFFGSFIAWHFSRKGWIILNHNIRMFGGDVLVLHNVFSAEHEQDTRSFLSRQRRWLNPVFTLRIFRERFMLKQRKVVCGVSSKTADEAKPFINKDSIILSINNGVDTDRFSPLCDFERNKLREEMKLDDKFVVVFVGHEFERKGLMPLIKSLQFLPPDICLLVIGGRGSNRESYKKEATRLGIDDRIKFMGTILETAPYYQVADVFALPSSYEAWPLVGLEAMSCGTPTLMTAVGGIPEFLVDGENGMFIESSEESISNKINKIITNKDDLNKMRIGARNTALNNSWETVALKYLMLIKDIKKEIYKNA